MPTKRRALVWLRRDLRLEDQAVLARATSIADEVAVMFVFDRVILDALADRDDRRVTFIHRSVSELSSKLAALGSHLIVRVGDPTELVPSVAVELEADLVVAGRDYEPYAIERDARVTTALQAEEIEFEAVKDHVIFEPGEVLTEAGAPFRVFSPFARAWRAKFDASRDAPRHDPDLSNLLLAATLRPFGEDYSFAALGFTESGLWLEAGEDAARRRLDAFSEQIARYGEERDFPAKHGTSGLSVHLRFGTISIRAAVRRALKSESTGADKWLAELIWREFYQTILGNFPRVVSEPFQEKYAGLEYPGSEDEFRAWCEGRTGYPLVDAALRCFNATGWMHNRLRMVVASFLTKDLLVDYRWGEAYFARFLLDFELASNNGGWQWASSVGCDPQPYFRIFNPVLQSLKFDPEGAFIREWLPELKELTGKAIHAPWESTSLELAAAGVLLGETYPRPIVHHTEQRKKAIALLGEARDAAE